MDKDSQEIFSQRLRELRLKKGLTQKQVADMLHVQRSTYTQYETGRVPSIETVRKLARVFGVSVDYLLGVENDPRIKSLDFEGAWPLGAQIFRRASKEWTETRKREVETMLQALLNNLPEKGENNDKK